MAAPLLSLHLVPVTISHESRTMNLMDHPVPGVRKPLWCSTYREGKKLPSTINTINPRPVVFLLEYKRLLHALDDRSIGCLSTAVIQRDDGGLVYIWPPAQGMHSVFAGFSAHPAPSNQELSLEVRSGFKVLSTVSSTCLTDSLAHLRHI